MHNHSYTHWKQTYIHSGIQHVHHHSLNIKYNWRSKIDKNTYLIRTRPATSYVALMFHPTIGQCAHQSLNNTTTLELGMTSTRNNGTLVDSYIAKGATKLSQANTVGFIRM